MKRTNLVTKIVAALLFVAVVAYIGFYAISALSGGYRTAPAVLVEIGSAVELTGVIARDELCIDSEEQYLSVSAESGKMLAVGDTIAVAYSSEEALSRASEIHELELKAQYIQSVLDGKNSESVAKKDSDIKSAVTALAAAAARHKTGQLASASLNLSALILDRSDISATEADLQTAKNQITSLKQSAARDTRTLAATESGLFCSSADGYEYLTEDSVKALSPSQIEALPDSPHEVAISVRGKMVYGNAWYYAAILTAEQATALEVGKYVNLDFGRYCSGSVNALIVSIGHTEKDRCAAVFRCTSDMAETLALRFASAEIISPALTGLRVPKEACYTEQNDAGETLTYVYVSESGRADKRYITISQDMGDYYLAEQSFSENSLLVGNDLLLTSSEPTDGELMD